MRFAPVYELSFVPLLILPEAASGWLRFGVTALPITAPPASLR
jgi:hypothetical protein